MMWGRVAALAAALLMGTPGLAGAGSTRMIWVELCDTSHPGARIPLPLGPDGDDAPAKACHAACAIPGDRRLQLRRQ